MALNKDEKLLLEAIDGMLQDSVKLGLSIHDDPDEANKSRGYEYLHGQIDDMFALKASELTFHENVCSAFSKVHCYKYIDDPSFVESMEKEMTATGVPAEERSKACEFVPSIINELKKEQADWAEKDAGFNPNLEEIKETSQPEQPMDFDIVDVEDYNKSNVTWDKGDASPSRTPSEWPNQT